MNPVKALALLLPKTTSYAGMPQGGIPLDKMLIAGALAGASRNAQNAALCIWCFDESLTLELAEQLVLETYNVLPPKQTGLKNTTALNLANWVITETKYPRHRRNKKTGQQELAQLSNAQLAIKAGIARQNFTATHEIFYNSAIGVFQSWLNEAFDHMWLQLKTAC